MEIHRVLLGKVGINLHRILSMSAISYQLSAISEKRLFDVGSGICRMFQSVMAGLDPRLSGLKLAMLSKTAGIAPHIEETGLQDLNKSLTLRKPRSGCLEGRGAAFSLFFLILRDASLLKMRKKGKV
jgi:hypothetical protein